ncbi:hypothetical protein HCH52_03370 [Oscillospiraceae bacterium HV4-5-C5C]|nr:hypothetical protein [Oscillospiraceae bacterium HV4-5-C5C]
MTLLVTVFAAIISTVIWYKHAPQDELKMGTLSLIYWGASLMWLVDAIFEFAELKSAYFNPAPADLLNELFLGLSVTALGLLIWLAILLLKDPRGVVRQALKRSAKPQ